MQIDLPKNFFPKDPVEFVHGHYMAYRRTTEEKLLVIPLIPKNGSQTISRNTDRNWRREYNRQKESNLDARVDNYIIVLRDPMKRWISGTVEYCVKNDIDIKKIDLTKIVFDEHTVPQINHLYGITPSKCDFYILEDNGLKNIYKKYNIKTEGITKNHNETIQDKKKHEPTNFLINTLKNDLNLSKTIEKFYASDLFLLEKIRKELSH